MRADDYNEHKLESLLRRLQNMGQLEGSLVKVYPHSWMREEPLSGYVNFYRDGQIFLTMENGEKRLYHGTDSQIDYLQLEF